jgi:hypothetical protein
MKLLRRLRMSWQDPKIRLQLTVLIQLLRQYPQLLLRKSMVYRHMRLRQPSEHHPIIQHRYLNITSLGKLTRTYHKVVHLIRTSLESKSSDYRIRYPTRRQKTPILMLQILTRKTHRWTK